MATTVTVVVLTQMSTESEDRSSLDEHEHQILDTLDSLALGSVWTDTRAGLGEVSGEFKAAVADAGEDLDEVEAAIANARPLFLRLISVMAERLLLAAEALAETDDRGALDPESIARTRTALNESPERSPALASAVESVGVSLGLDRQALAWAVLIDLGERASADVDEALRSCSLAITERLTAAQPSSSVDTPPPSRALRVFRSAAVSAAGPEIRARYLAAGHPEHLAIARALVEAHEDPSTLVDQFDAAKAALDAAAKQAKDQSPELVTDGPKRKFTVVHLILALIILGLTIWHYWFR